MADALHHHTTDTDHQEVTTDMLLHQAAMNDIHQEITTDMHLHPESMQLNTIATVNTETTHVNIQEVQITTDVMIVIVFLPHLQKEVHHDRRTAHMHPHQHVIAVTTLLVMTGTAHTDQVILTQGQVLPLLQNTTNPSKKVPTVTSTVPTCRVAVLTVHQRQVPTAHQDPRRTVAVLMAQAQLQVLLHQQHTLQVHAID